MTTETVARSRTEQTFATLRQAVVGGDFLPGDRLRIDQLGKRYGASIGAVREALSRLTAEGLVVAEPQKGFVVAPISRKDLTDLTEVRVDIESRCLIEAMRHGDHNWEGRILSLQHQLKALGPKPGGPVDSPFSREWHKTHEAFHEALTDACPNLWWLKLRRHLFLQSDRYRHYSGPVERTGRDVEAEHEAIVTAALARNEAAARQAVSDHLWRTANLILGSSLPFSEEP